MDPEIRGRLLAPQVFAFALIWLVVQFGVTLTQNPSVLAGAQLDPDGYLRLVRIGQLLETRSWFDSSILRSNWPFGESHHWTRPLDVLILLLALPFAPFMGLHSAVATAGSLVSPLTHLSLCIATVWVVRPLVPGPERFLAMPAVLVQPGILAYGTAGRADHHALLFLLYLLAVGAWVRALLRPDEARYPVGAGVFSALGIWISPETLLPLALLFVSGGLVWWRRGREMVRPNLGMSFGLVLGLGVGLMVERPPSNWISGTLDRISDAHVVMGLLALAFWVAVHWMEGGREAGLADGQHGAADEPHSTGIRRPAPGLAKGSRLSVGLVGALLTGVLLYLLHPGFLRGPWSEVHPEVLRLVFPTIQELQPLFPSGWHELGPFLVHMGPALVVVPSLAAWTWREWESRRGMVWGFLLLSALTYVTLASAQLRLSGYAGGVFAISLVVLLHRGLKRAHGIGGSLRRRTFRVGWMVILLLGPFIGGTLVGAVTGGLDEREDVGEGAPSERCPLVPMAGFLSEPDGLGAVPRALVAPLNFGPELLYRTPHGVLAGPYHRNHEGFLAAHAFFTSSDDEASLTIARARGLDLILLCPMQDRIQYDTGDESSLYRRLLRGDLPAWVEPIDLPERLDRGFLLFRVDVPGSPEISTYP